jgi:hypothetical protein
MHEVEELFAKQPCKTRLWASDAARESIFDLDKTVRGQFLKKLSYYCQHGFAAFSVGDKAPIRHVWGGVYRIGIRSSLYRLVGFFENDGNFIAIDGFEKRGQKLGAAESARIDKVATVKANGTWKRKVVKSG